MYAGNYFGSNSFGGTFGEIFTTSLIELTFSYALFLYQYKYTPKSTTYTDKYSPQVGSFSEKYPKLAL